jgi:hypothetical protein
MRHVRKSDGKRAFVIRRFVVCQQGAEDRIAIKPRQAAPNDPPAPVYQSADAAVADNAEIKTTQG